MPRPRTFSVGTQLMCLVCIVASTAASSGFSAERLHETIDRLIEDAGLGMGSPPADDATFFRRVHLDLVGTIPTAAETRSFLADATASKRENLVDRLLADRRHAAHLANVFDVMLQERRGVKHITDDEWRSYLNDSIAANKSWDELVHEILAADGTDTKNRPATGFYFARDGDADLITRDIGRMFFGMDLQCCQCHDHPLIADFLQSDYYGIYAFVNRGFVFTDPDKKVFYAEKADGDVQFTSVFTEEESSTLPRLPGQHQITEPVFLAGEEYQVAPAKDVKPVPRYSRRKRLAELTTNRSNYAFNRNIVNRLWCLLMGRGFVDPLDLNHPDNPAVHPELLDLLAARFAADGYDVRAFLGELAKTRTYQRSLKYNAHRVDSQQLQTRIAESSATAGDRERKLDQVRDELKATAVTLERARQELEEARRSFRELNKQVAESRKKTEQEKKKLEEGRQKRTNKNTIAKAIRTASEKARAAAVLLGDDALLIDAGTKFERRAKELAKQISAIDETIPALEQAWESAVAKLTESQTAANAVIKQLTARQEHYHTSVSPAQTAASERIAAETRLHSIEGQLRLAKQVVAMQQSESLLESTRREAQRIESAVLELSPRLEAQLAKLPGIEEQLVSLERAKEERTQKLVTARQALSEYEVAEAALLEAVKSAQSAVEALKKDDALRGVASSLKKRLEAFQANASEPRESVNAHEEQLKELDGQIAELQRTLNKTRAEQQQLAAWTAQLPDLQAQSLKAEASYRDAEAAWAETAQENFFVGSLRPLTPEQIGRSILHATGFVARQRIVGQSKALEKVKDGPNAAEERLRFTDDFVREQTQKQLKTFVKLFAHAGGQPQGDFFATVDQALFFSNAGNLQSWLTPSKGSLVARLAEMDDAPALAEELYLSVLTRLPSDEETSDIVTYLADRSDARNVAIGDLAWALITSAEFRFNH